MKEFLCVPKNRIFWLDDYENSFRLSVTRGKVDWWSIIIETTLAHKKLFYMTHPTSFAQGSGRGLLLIICSLDLLMLQKVDFTCFIYLLIFLFIYLFINLFIYLFIYLFIFSYFLSSSWAMHIAVTVTCCSGRRWISFQNYDEKVTCV